MVAIDRMIQRFDVVQRHAVENRPTVQSNEQIWNLDNIYVMDLSWFYLSPEQVDRVAQELVAFLTIPR